MRRYLLIVASLFALSLFACTSITDDEFHGKDKKFLGKEDEFHGIIESRPEGRVGTWVVGGRSVQVTVRAEFKEEHGLLTVGACAEVELKGDVVAEIESELKRKCEKRDIALQGKLVEEEEEEEEEEDDDNDEHEEEDEEEKRGK